MSESEDFLVRWSRLKRESDLEKSAVDEKRAAGASPDADVPSLPAFDPASLPPIESIVADSDIRLFLQACVPAELTRAALRSAWAADPAIRDFIGIAESQWDFNDPATIPGFGSLKATDYAQHLVARTLENLNTATEGTPESAGIVERPATTSSDPQCYEPVDEVSQVTAAPADGSHDADLDGQVGETSGLAKRSHGSALPQ